MLTNKQEKKQGEIKRDGVQQLKQQAQQLNPSASPPSSSSSPSHEFSFTISLHPSTAATKIPDKNKSNPPPFAIDLSPADEIFFHGHLLPLHLLSHLPVSPRSSTNSLDSFTLPIKELSQDNTTRNDDQYTNGNSCQERTLLEEKARGKSKSFSLFGLPKWRKGEKNCQEGQKGKSKFEISHFLQRYMRLVKPYLPFRKNPQIHRQQPYSFSGNLKLKSKKELRGRRGEFSAPASMINSPTNSGLLVASGNHTPMNTSDSTMEELQAAIQAAIAHCKKSIATEDKNKLP
ncbi:hypothetical protein DH2020_035308 [Rehmannia glutinosa]|uniref:BRI1 kinase inhibitor 1-like n=1 Tax=Rehmannia glutinosa TaxID=99300 RepID=A0ABR0VA27_REHGL